MNAAGKIPHYLPDMLFGRKTELMSDSLNQYHTKLADYIARH